MWTHPNSHFHINFILESKQTMELVVKEVDILEKYR